MFCRCRGGRCAALRLPSRCGRTLLRPRPRSAPRRRVPRCSLRYAPGQRLPTPMSTRGPRGLRSDRPPAVPAVLTPHPKTLPTPLKQGGGGREGGGEIRPAGRRSHHAGASGHRAARPAGGDAGPDRASHAREGNSEGPHAGLCPAAGGIVREGGSEGWARSPARVTWLRARGAKNWWCGAPPEGAASFHLARPLSIGTPPNAIPRKWDIRGKAPRRKP